MLSLLNDLDKWNIILASQSPRRFELLRMIGLDFKTRPSNVDEIYMNHMSPLEYATLNARNKGAYVAEKYPDHLVISADTIVVFRDRVLEKPKDEKHAYEILSLLGGNTHEVITAFGITHAGENKSVFDYESTKVTFRKLSSDDIHAYINTGEPFDKAGGYGAQGNGALLIERVNGCFFNVVGLPLARFFKTLDTFLMRIPVE